MIEIKPISMMDIPDIEIKLFAGLMNNTTQNYLILTEEEIFDENYEWVKELEYIHVEL